MPRQSGGGGGGCDDAENGDSKHPPDRPPLHSVLRLHTVNTALLAAAAAVVAVLLFRAHRRRPTPSLPPTSPPLHLYLFCERSHAHALTTLTRRRRGWTLRNLMNLTLDLAIINPRFIIKLCSL